MPNVVTKVTSSISTEKKDGLCEVNDSKVGDGICDDLANNELCVYDGGDCCLDVTLTDLSFCTVRYKYCIYKIQLISTDC